MYLHLNQHIRRTTARAMAIAAALICADAAATLPAPTPEQQQAAAAKKAQAAAQTEKEKQELAASMDKVASHWRTKAAANGLKTQSPGAASPKGDSSAAPGATTTPVRSEKLGTAPPSEDVKQPAKKGPPAQIK